MFLLGVGSRPSQGSTSVFLLLLLFVFLCSKFPELCSVTKPKLGYKV